MLVGSRIDAQDGAVNPELTDARLVMLPDSWMRYRGERKKTLAQREREREGKRIEDPPEETLA